MRSRFSLPFVVCSPVVVAALHQAAWYGQEGAVEMLLRAGAETSIKTPAGLTAADIAQQMGNVGTLKILTGEHARKIQQQESAEQLRARIKAQYCRVRENSCRRQISAPRPLPQTTIKCDGDTGRGSRPVLPHASPHRRTAKETEKCGSISTTPQAVRRAQTCSEADINQHAPRWLPSGASTARARAEREDVAMLPDANCASTYKSKATQGQYPGTETRDAKIDQDGAGKERVSTGVEEGDAYVFLNVVGAVEYAADAGKHGCSPRERNVSKNAAFFLTELGV